MQPKEGFWLWSLRGAGGRPGEHGQFPRSSHRTWKFSFDCVIPLQEIGQGHHGVGAELAGRCRRFEMRGEGTQ